MAPRCVVGPSDQKQVWRKLVLAGQEIGCAVLIGHRVDGLAAGRHAGLLHEGHDPAVEVRHLVDWLAGLHVQTENFNVGPGAIIVVDDTGPSAMLAFLLPGILLISVLIHCVVWDEPD